MNKCAALLLVLALAPAKIAPAQQPHDLQAAAAPTPSGGAAYIPTLLSPAATAGAAAPAAALPLPTYGAWVNITKWATLGASAGLGIYGFKLNGDADDIFSNLETLCQQNPENCRSRNPDGSYTDPLLESLYQDAVNKDNAARTLLIASQLFFGASVVLFIVDFQRDDGPGNVPFEPQAEKSRLQFVALPGTLAVRYYLR